MESANFRPAAHGTHMVQMMRDRVVSHACVLWVFPPSSLCICGLKKRLYKKVSETENTPMLA